MTIPETPSHRAVLGPRPSSAWNEALGFAGIAFTLRLFLIALYPALYGGDPIARMLHPERIVLAYQLPLLQALVALVYGFVDHPLAARLLSAATGAFATLGIYVLARNLAGRRTARYASAFFLVNPLMVVYSLMPYQEPLMIGLLSLAGGFYSRRRWVPMSVALGLACLTRYESWVVAACLLGAALYRERERLGGEPPERAALRVVGLVLRFGWAPLVWMAWNGAVAPAGTYVADMSWSWARLLRVPYLTERVAVYTPYAVFLAPLGLWLARRRRRWIGLAWPLGVVTVAIVVLAHDYPPGTPWVSERLAHLPVCGAVLLSAFALAKLASRRREGRAASAVAAGAVIAILASSVFLSVRQVRARSAAPEVATTERLAEYLSRYLPPGERALVVARPLDQGLIRHYLDRIARLKPAEIAAARRLVAELALPEPYQRLVVSLPRGRERLVEAGSWRGEAVAVAVVYEDARDRIPRGLFLSAHPLASFGAEDGGGLPPLARVYFAEGREVSR